MHGQAMIARRTYDAGNRAAPQHRQPAGRNILPTLHLGDVAMHFRGRRVRDAKRNET